MNNNENKSMQENINEFVEQVNFERKIEIIMKQTKVIYDAALQTGFNEEYAFYFANQHYCKCMDI